jgi:hypothetical protein
VVVNRLLSCNRVTMTTEQRSGMQALVAQILTSEHLSFQVIEQACRLLIADVHFNSWCASVGKKLGLAENAWLEMLDEYNAIYEACDRAWKAFQIAEWPKGQSSVWEQNLDDLSVVLTDCTNRTDRLGGREFRPGHR